MEAWRTRWHGNLHSKEEGDEDEEEEEEETRAIAVHTACSCTSTCTLYTSTVRVRRAACGVRRGAPFELKLKPKATAGAILQYWSGALSFAAGCMSRGAAHGARWRAE